jgi:molybdopterin-guanine dinucleotide biosynthesis protein A
MVAALSSGPPVGVVLAGGLGRRLGGDKAIVELEGRPLALYAVEALHELCDDVVVVAKRDTVLPPLAGAAELWIEPDEPRHPLAGVAHALRLAAGRSILVVAVDLPLMDGATLRLIAQAEPVPPALAAVVVPRVHGRLEPLCALYTSRALPGLEDFDPDARATDIVRGLGICEVAPPDPSAFYNVNRPEDLLQVSVLLNGMSS